MDAISDYSFSTHPEDRATLRSDPSAEMSTVRMEAGAGILGLFFIPPSLWS
jgi:hypothetical protein